MKCPICHGFGEINTKSHTFNRNRAIVVLRREGFSIRDVMKIMKYKSPRSVTATISRYNNANKKEVA